MSIILPALIRSLQRPNKFSILNVIGLCIGFTFINLIAVFIIREFRYDTFHKKANELYLVETSVKNDDGTINKGKHFSLDQLNALQSDIPGITDITFLNYSYFDWDNGTWIKYKDNRYQLEKVAFTNASFAKVFSFQTVSGNLSQALNDPYSLVLSQEKALKIFGNEDPIGKKVYLNNQLVTVNAVVDGNPRRSSVQFDGLINYQAAKYFTGHAIEDNSNLAFLETKASNKDLELQIKNLLLQELPLKVQKEFKNRVSINMVPLTESYFREGDAYDPMRHGNKTLVYIILVIGFLILLMAFVNYVNLSFAGSFKRHKEIAIKSISGAKRKNLFVQFISEGLLISFIAYLISILVSNILLPWFNSLIDYPITAGELLKLSLLLLTLAIAVVTGFLSGLIPSIWILKLNSVQLIKGQGQTTGKYTIWRYLVLFQMVISIVLISGTLIISRQINFINKKHLGFETQNIITLPAFKLEKGKDTFLQKVDHHPATESRAQSSTYLNNFNQWGGEIIENGQKKDVSYLVIHANSDFLSTLKIQLLRGRNFENHDSADINTCIINQTAMRDFSLSDPFNAKLNGMQIIGIVDDMHIKSLHHQVEPIVIFNSPNNKTGLTSIRFKATNRVQIAEYVHFLRMSWSSLSPDKPFEFEFLDQRLRTMYEKDIKLMKAFSSFSILAIIIACLGLFGLVSFIAETKVREIGIRKVNGARTTEVMTMLNQDFIKWVGIAFLIACPIAWYAMHKWLENFAYKTNLSWWVFVAAGGIAMVIALLTVSFQSWRAATRNPVESLRYE